MSARDAPASSGPSGAPQPDVEHPIRDERPDSAASFRRPWWRSRVLPIVLVAALIFTVGLGTGALFIRPAEPAFPLTGSQQEWQDAVSIWVGENVETGDTCLVPGVSEGKVLMSCERIGERPRHDVALAGFNPDTHTNSSYTFVRDGQHESLAITRESGDEAE